MVHFPDGIADTEGFWPDLVSRPHVKAFMQGHVHDGTRATFAPDGVALQIRTCPADHLWDGERTWLFWWQPRV